MRQPARTHYWLFLVCLLLSVPAHAANLMMVRSQLPFSEAQGRLQQAIEAQGYIVSRVQRVDIDLVSIGFSQGTYRAVSYAKPEELIALSERYPEFTPFLPLQVVIFAEGNDSLLVAVNPLYYQKFFTQPELVEAFKRWSQDLQLILEAVRDVEEK